MACQDSQETMLTKGEHSTHQTSGWNNKHASLTKHICLNFSWSTFRVLQSSVKKKNRSFFRKLEKPLSWFGSSIFFQGRKRCQRLEDFLQSCSPPPPPWRNTPGPFGSTLTKQFALGLPWQHFLSLPRWIYWRCVLMNVDESLHWKLDPVWGSNLQLLKVNKLSSGCHGNKLLLIKEITKVYLYACQDKNSFPNLRIWFGETSITLFDFAISILYFIGILHVLIK